MPTTVAEIAPDIYRLSTWIDAVAPPAGFTFNQFLVLAEEPLLFHCGHRQAFPLLAEALARIIPVGRLRWISFGHVEADECGAMNQWLAAAPQAQVVHGALGCDVSLNDMADRPPRALAEGEVLDLGGKRVRWIGTPHLPHGWEAGVLYEETDKTLLCGDLLTRVGDGPPVTEGDVLTPAIEAEAMFHAMCMTPQSGAMLRGLAGLRPRTLALMHGSSFSGDGAVPLLGLADHCEQQAGKVLGSPA